MANIIYNPSGITQTSNAFEQKVLELLKKLPKEWLLFPNFHFMQPAQCAKEINRLMECDVVIAAPHAIYLVEIKEWYGTISGDANTWRINDGESRKCPLILTNHKCKVLKSCIESWHKKQHKSVPDFEVIPVLVVPDNTRFNNLTGEWSGYCCPASERLLQWLTRKEGMIYPTSNYDLLPNFEIIKESILGPWYKLQNQERRRIEDYNIKEELGVVEHCNIYTAHHACNQDGSIYRIRLWKNCPDGVVDDEFIKQQKTRAYRNKEAVSIIGQASSIVKILQLSYKTWENEYVEIIEWSPLGTLDTCFQCCNIDGNSENLFSLQESLHILQELASGLNDMHKSGVVHRNISPSSILMSTKTHPCITDFDYACHSAFHDVFDNIDGWKTNPYAPPECLSGTHNLATPSVDLYSLGVLIYKLLTNNVPFHSPQEAKKRKGIPAKKIADCLSELHKTSYLEKYREVAPASFLEQHWEQCMRELSELSLALLDISPSKRPAAQDTYAKIQEINTKLQNPMQDSKISPQDIEQIAHRLQYSVLDAFANLEKDFNANFSAKLQDLTHRPPPHTPIPPDKQGELASEEQDDAQKAHPVSSQPLIKKKIFTTWPNISQDADDPNSPQDPYRREIANVPYEKEGHIQGVTISDYPVKTLIFRDCIFKDTFRITSCNFETLKLQFENCTFEKSWGGSNRKSEEKSTYYRSLQFSGCTFKANLNLMDSQFSELLISNCRILDNDGKLQLNRSTVQGSVELDKLKCKTFSAPELRIVRGESIGKCLFKQIDIEDGCNFQGAIVEVPAEWQKCNFAQDADFSESVWEHLTFGGKGKVAHSVKFAGNAKFKGTRFNVANFRGSEFAQEADFDNSFFGVSDSHSFASCVFQGNASFRNIQFPQEDISGKLSTKIGISYENAVFHGDFACILQNTNPADNKLTINLLCNHVKFEQQADFLLEGDSGQVSLYLRRVQAKDLHIKGNYRRIHLHHATVNGTSKNPLLENMSTGIIRLHCSNLSNTQMIFVEPTKPGVKENIELYAPGATWKDVVITGYFRGKWRTPNCNFHNVQWRDLTVAADLDLNGCTIEPTPNEATFSMVRFRYHPPRKKKLRKSGHELSLQSCDLLKNLQFVDCALDNIDLRGSKLHAFAMRNGRCKSLLVRRELPNKVITIYAAPSSHDAWRDEYARANSINRSESIQDSPISDPNAIAPSIIENEKWRNWLENELSKVFCNSNEQESSEHLQISVMDKYPIIRVVLEKPTKSPSDIADMENTSVSEDLEKPTASLSDIADMENTSVGEKNSETQSHQTDIEQKDQISLGFHNIIDNISNVHHDGSEDVISQSAQKFYPIESYPADSTYGKISLLAKHIQSQDTKLLPTCTDTESLQHPESDPMSGNIMFAGTKRTALSSKEECDIFCIKMTDNEADADSTNKEEDSKSAVEEDLMFIEIDISRHKVNPLSFLQRKLKHHYRSTEIRGWELSEFEIGASDQISTPWTKPIFHDVKMEGATIHGNLFDNAIIEGTFRTESACAFVSASFCKTEFRGPVLLSHSTIENYLNMQAATFLSSLSLLHLRCNGTMQLQHTQFRGASHFANNFVADHWRLDNSEFVGPVLWENEEQSRGLCCLETKFNANLQMRNAKWNGDIVWERALFAQECSLYNVQARNLKCFKTEFNGNVQIRKSKWTEDISLEQAVFGRECLFDVVEARSLNTLPYQHLSDNPNQDVVDGYKVTQFNGDLFLRHLRLEDHLSLVLARFAGTLLLEEVNVFGAVIFFACECSRDVFIRHLTAANTFHVTRSSFSERLVIEDTSQLHSINLNRSLCYGPLIVRGTLSPQDILTSQGVAAGCLYILNMYDMRCLNDVSLENLVVKHFICVKSSIFTGNVSLHRIKFYIESIAPEQKHISPYRLGGFGSIEFCDTEIYNQLSLRDIHEAGVFFQKTLIRNELDVRSFSPDYPLFCSLGEAVVGQILFPDDPMQTLVFAKIIDIHSKDDGMSKEQSSSSSRYDFSAYPILTLTKSLQPDEQNYVYQQKAQHYAQLYQLSLKHKKYQDAREFRHAYRKALKAITFAARIAYLQQLRIQEMQQGESRFAPPLPMSETARKVAPPSSARVGLQKSDFSSPILSIPASSSIASPVLSIPASTFVDTSYPKRSTAKNWFYGMVAFGESVMIQVGEKYDDYGRSPRKLLFWLLIFNTLFSLTYGFYGWDWTAIALVWVDALLTPVGLLLQGLGLIPFGSTFPSLWLKAYFFIHTAMLTLMWLNFISLLFPGLLSKERLSKILTRRTGIPGS